MNQGATPALTGKVLSPVTSDEPLNLKEERFSKALVAHACNPSCHKATKLGRLVHSQEQIWA
jgi:hypothetical protein